LYYNNIVKFIKKNYLLLSAIGLVILYFVTRLTNILSLPIFTDEAIYVRWAQIAANDANWRFISLTDGKQPSFVWIGMILMKIFDDPLLAGRMVSVIAGFFLMIGIYFLSNEIFNPSAPLRASKIGLLASLIYVIFPFSLVYDRLALYDSLVAMFIIWALYLEVLLVRKPRLDTALILGMVIGGGMLTKTSANFAFILLPFSLLLFDFKQKNWRKFLLRWAGLAAVSVLVAHFMYAVLRLSPFFHIISEKNNVFVYPFSEWIRSPFGYFTGNIKGLSEWLITYVSAPFLVLSASAFLVVKKFTREKLLLVVWFAAPFTALALFGRVIYPRFILFMSMPLLVLGAYALFNMIKTSKKKWVKIAVPVVFLGSFIVNGYLIITDFSKANIPSADREQFVTGWPSGVGVSETVEFLREESKDKKVFVGTQGTFGLMPYALEMYFVGNPNVEIKGYWPIDDTVLSDVASKAAEMPSYLVFYQPCPPCARTGVAPDSWMLNEVFQLEKEAGDTYYTLYEVKK
jgi:4-amino-4-deoxy-L-arabinose transferase-like glycosyltransferase